MTDSAAARKAEEQLRQLAKDMGLDSDLPLEDLLLALSPDAGLPQEMRAPLARVLDALAKARRS